MMRTPLEDDHVGLDRVGALNLAAEAMRALAAKDEFRMRACNLALDDLDCDDNNKLKAAAVDIAVVVALLATRGDPVGTAALIDRARDLRFHWERNEASSS